MVTLLDRLLHHADVTVIEDNSYAPHFSLAARASGQVP